jgi:hypothetical protein
MLNPLIERIPFLWRANLFLSAFGIFKVPLIWYTRARLLSIDSQRVQLKIPLRRRNANHLRSMYFGALCIGADICGGILAVWRIRQSGARIDFVFKQCKAEFLKRAEDDVVFESSDGDAIALGVEQALKTGERVNIPLHIVARVPSRLGDDPVAKFELTLSIKKRST